MTKEQIQKRAVELFNEYGPGANRAAFSQLYEEVNASGRIFNGNFHHEIEKLGWAVYPIPAFLQDKVNALNTLINKTATIVKEGDLGYCHSIVCTIEKVRVANYAQHDNCIFIQYRSMKKRSSYELHVLPHTGIAVFAGDQVPNTKTQEKVISETAEIRVVFRGLAFDPAHFTGAVNSIKANPVFIANNNPQV